MTVYDVVKRLMLMLVLVLAVAAFAACDTADDTDTNQEEQEAGNAIDEAGESLEEAAEDTGAAIEEGAEAAGANVDEAADDVGEAADEAGEELDQAADEAGEELEETGAELDQAAEEAGEEIDEAAQETGEELEEAGEALDQAAEETGEELEQAGEEAGEELEQAADEAGEELEEAGEDVEQAADEVGEEVQEELAESVIEFNQWTESTDDELREAAQSIDEAAEETGEELEEAGEEVEENVEEAGEEVAEEVNEVAEDIAELGEVLTVEQPVIVNDRLVIDSAYSQESGFLVIQNATAEGTPGEVIGWTTVEDGVNDDVGVDIDTTRATATLYATVYDDVDGDGVFTEGADTPESIDGELVSSPITVSIMDANDQFVAQPQILINSVIVQQPTWVVVYAGDDSPNRVLGSTLVQAGTTPNVAVPINDVANVTPALWVMLHPDTGTAGTFEFGQVDDADQPLPEGDDAVGAKIYTVSHVRVRDQGVDDSGAIIVQSVLSQGPGILVAHADNDGEPGDVLGSVAVPDGYSQDIAIPLIIGDMPDHVMLVLHTDAGTAGQYDEGVDMPVMVNDDMVTDTFEIED